MFETKFLHISKLYGRYQKKFEELRGQPDWGDWPDDNNFFDAGKIQLAGGSDYSGYEYLADRRNKYFYLQCLLHGAAKKLTEEGERTDEFGDYEDSLLDFLVNELKLLLGMFCFIDPRSGTEDEAQSIYLLGRFNESELKPSFTFPFFVNTKNIRNNREFHKVPDEWLAFYLDFNTATREHLLFKHDFVKFFGEQDWRRNKGPEKRHRVFYASSGEIDHTILQWLFCSLRPDIGLNRPFPIRVSHLLKDKSEVEEDVKECLRRHGQVADSIITTKGVERFLGKPSGKRGRAEKGQPKSATIKEWLQCFGLLNDTGRKLPTERLLAAIEFFYFHLTYRKVEKGKGEKEIGLDVEGYFSKYEGEGGYYSDWRSGSPGLVEKVEKFIECCENNLPVRNKSYQDIRGRINSHVALDKKLSDVVWSYLSLLEAFAAEKPGVKFAEYARFNVLSHFFQRYVLPLYSPLHKEQTCRGFIITPIFSNPNKPSDSGAKNLGNLGYFLGLIKDSDAKGRCFFNWRTHSDSETESGTIAFFYKDYLFYLQKFVYDLGMKEVKQIYYKGIEEKHAREIERQATRAAIADIINRNQAHHIGSHVSNRATLDKILERLGKSHEELEKKNFYLSVLDMLNRLNQYRDERSEYLTYLAQFSSPSSGYLFKDVLQPFIENTLLMDNIAANENINYVPDGDGRLSSNKLKIYVRLKDGGQRKSLRAVYLNGSDEVLYTSEDLPYLRTTNEKGYEYEKVQLTDEHGLEVNDIEVSLPGTLGKHALYSFFENFIRNSAKHGFKAEHERLEVIIELSDLENPDRITVEIKDNCSVVSEETVAGLNRSIGTRILDRENLGLIDMKVNACLLEARELTDDNCSKALEADKTSDDILFYRFRIARPKKAAFIGCYPQAAGLGQSGYYHFPKADDFLNAPINKAFQFAVFGETVLAGLPDAKKRNRFLSQLPARILNYKDVEKDLAEGGAAEILPTLYKHWNARLSNSEKPDHQIHITFQQGKREHPTERLSDAFKDSPILKVYSKDDLIDRSRISFDRDRRHIFFDRHGAIMGERRDSFDNSFVRDTKGSGRDHCWILIDKNNTDFDYISRYDLTQPELLPCELAEAGLLRVLVIDERAAEESVRVFGEKDEARKLDWRPEFYKFNLNPGANRLTLFDAAWAARVFIATHLNGAPLKQEIDISAGDKHVLKVDINGGGIAARVNFTSLYATYESTRVGGVRTRRWVPDGVQPKLTEIQLKPHVLVIHRTKLKELMGRYGESIVEKVAAEVHCLIVTTGSGTTHGLEGDFKILPFSTLNELLLGRRIQKLRLTKLLLELTKNRI